MGMADGRATQRLLAIAFSIILTLDFCCRKVMMAATGLATL
jgi:hypothetical protein